MLSAEIRKLREEHDLVELLRSDDVGCSEECLCGAAAAEIESLRGQLRDAEEEIAVLSVALKELDQKLYDVEHPFKS